MIIITAINNKIYNAGPKAVNDVIQILKEKYKNQVIEKTVESNGEYNENRKNLKVIMRKINSYLKRISLLISLRVKNDILILQYPFAKMLWISNLIPKKNTILIIHDLNGLRKMNEKIERKEIRYLKKFKMLIVHNQKMKAYLLKKGCEDSKIKVLELFDYLAETTNARSDDINNDELCIDFVGNLSKDKSSFIYEIEEDKMNFKINLYGQGYAENNNSKLNYMGAFPPEELLNHLNGQIGLVWDGKLNEKDEINPLKNYTKYNNPHKLSCYIASEKPVIVWEKAAIADLVKKYNIGYTINNLYEINKIDFSNYNEKKKNVVELSKKVKSGYFTKKVFDEVIKDSTCKN